MTADYTTIQAPAASAGSLSIRSEHGNALGELQVSAPLLAEKLLPLTGYSHMVLGMLRAVDLYRQVYGVKRVRIDTWTSGDELRHRLHASHTGPSLAPPQTVDSLWMIRRAYRMMEVLRAPGVLPEALRIVEVLDAYAARQRVAPGRLSMETGYPKFIRGMTYVVQRIAIL